MIVAGYSTTPLIKKLGIKPGATITLINAPENYLRLLGDLPERSRVRKRLTQSTDFVHLFATSESELLRRLPAAVRAVGRNGMLWLSWPKQASGVGTDLNGNLVRKMGLTSGLVDIKVCAIDATWSALKFVYRVKDR